MTYWQPEIPRLESSSLGTPLVMYSGGVDLSTGFVGSNFPGNGLMWVLQGIDLYPTVQPNNGDCIVSASSVHWPGPNVTIFQVQQSQNFPGPFHWRGNLPFWHGNNLFTVTATVGFQFVAWGVEVADPMRDWRGIQT